MLWIAYIFNISVWSKGSMTHLFEKIWWTISSDEHIASNGILSGVKKFVFSMWFIGKQMWITAQYSVNICFHCHTMKAYMHAESSSIEIIISSDVTRSPSDGSHLCTVTIHITPGNRKGNVFKKTTSCVCIQSTLRHTENKKFEKRFWTFTLDSK